MPRSLRAMFLALLVAWGTLLVACSAAPPRVPESQPPRWSNSSTVIYVIKRKWHVDIGFAARDLQPPLASLRADFPAAQYLLFGFGDRHYLLVKDRGFGGMLAALWPGPGLMLATGLTTTMQAAFGEDNVIEIRVTAAQARNAQQFVWQSLSVEAGAVTPLHEGPYDGSFYYSASKDYSAFHTCNTWAAEALHAADLPVHSAGIALSGQLWIQAQRIGARQSADPTGNNGPPSRASPTP
jgi:Protein of unknown function (DUF2459)